MRVHALVLDTETSGLENGQVIELCHAECILSGNGVLTQNLKTFRYGCEKMAFGAMNVHHILPEDIAGLPPYDPANFPQAVYYIGHNIDFDWKALGSPADVRRIDTLAMARKLWPNCDSYALGALHYYLKPFSQHLTRRRLRDAHSAETDVRLTVELLWDICRAAGIFDWLALYEFSEAARVPEIMTFGKFKGQPVWKVDNGWRGWYRKQNDPDPYLLEAFKKYPYGVEPPCM